MKIEITTNEYAELFTAIANQQAELKERLKLLSEKEHKEIIDNINKSLETLEEITKKLDTAFLNQ